MSDPYSLSAAVPLVHEKPFQAVFPLDSWGRLRVSGADTETFLQGQFSADLRTLSAQGAVWTSYNSPKGRMLAVLRMERTDEGIDLCMPADLVQAIGKRLRMFVLRSKVQIAPIETSCTDAATAQRDRHHLIAAGIPVVYPQTQDRWVAQMANLDLIGGVSFDKGCYTGQEVIARLHYLGNLKKRMFLVRGTGAAPDPGCAIRDAAGDGQAVGDIVDAAQDGAGFIASAVLQIGASDSATLVLDREVDAALARPQRWSYPARTAA